MSFITLTLTLFLIMNPFGNMKHFLTLLEGLPSKRRHFIVFREMVLALAFMYIFSFLGEGISKAFQIDNITCLIASAAILFLVGIKIIFPPKDDHIPRLHGEEPFLVPIAIPIIASPALLATILLFSQSEALVWPVALGIFLAWAVSSVILLGSQKFFRVLGQGGLTAIERLMGMVLILLAVQRFMEGIHLFISNLK